VSTYGKRTDANRDPPNRRPRNRSSAASDEFCGSSELAGVMMFILDDVYLCARIPNIDISPDKVAYGQADRS
jgi:hypothetical protein